jgi:SPP1 gp7 family putative phage head morphogenesis protein
MAPIWKRHAAVEFRSVIRETRPAFKRAAQEWLRAVRRAVKVTPAALAGGNVEAILARLCDWSNLREESLRIFGKPVLGAIHAALIKVRHVHFLKARLDPIGEKAVNAARTRSAKLVQQITDETRDAIRSKLADAIDTGRAIDDLARELRADIGLDDRFSKAVDNQFQANLDAGMDPEEAAARAEKYADELRDYRAEMIARTEAARSTSDGILEAYRENGITLVDWVGDPECCEDCQAMMDGGPYDIADVEDELPKHPNCECTWVFHAEEESDAAAAQGDEEAVPMDEEPPDGIYDVEPDAIDIGKGKA